MPTSTREHVLVWLQGRLDSIGGFAVHRNIRDDLTPELPAIAFRDPPEPPPAGAGPEGARNAEYQYEMTVEVAVGVRRAGAESGGAAGTAINDALAKIFNALLDRAAFATCVDDAGRPIVRNVQPGEIGMLEFLADSEAAETIALASRAFIVTYTTTDTDAYAASP